MFLEQSAGVAPIVLLLVATVQLLTTALLALYWAIGGADSGAVGQDWVGSYELNKGREQNRAAVTRARDATTSLRAAGIGDGQSALTSGDEGGTAAQAARIKLVTSERKVIEKEF